MSQSFSLRPQLHDIATLYPEEMRQLRAWGVGKLQYPTDGSKPEKVAVEVDNAGCATNSRLHWSDESLYLDYETACDVYTRNHDVTALCFITRERTGIVLHDADHVFPIDPDATREQNKRAAMDSWILQYLRREYGDRVVIELSTSCSGFHAYALAPETDGEPAPRVNKINVRPLTVEHEFALEQYDHGKLFFATGMVMDRPEHLQPCPEFVAIWQRMMSILDTLYKRCKEDDDFNAKMHNLWYHTDTEGSSEHDLSLVSTYLHATQPDDIGVEAAKMLFRFSRRRPHEDKPNSDYYEWERLLERAADVAVAGMRPRDARETIPDAPKVAGSDHACVLPTSYVYTPSDIQVMKVIGGKQKMVTVADAPIVLIERMELIDKGDVYLKLGWKRGGRWHELTESRATLVAEEREILKLAARDFPVGKHNKADLMKYIYDLDAANNTVKTNLTHRLTTTLGWQSDGSFMWGETHLQAPTPDGEQPTPTLEFHAESTGDAQFVKGFRAEGTYAGWRDAIARIKDYPAVIFGLYTSLAVPLQHVVKAPNFSVDWSGTTSRGKTSTLRTGASAWGQPEEGQPDKIIKGWDNTQVFIEQMLGMLNGLPAFLDDTRLALRKDIVERVLYEQAEGQGRGRGDVVRFRATRTWQNVLLMTGETPATQFTNVGGTKMRALEVLGSPLGEKNADFANKYREVLQDNFGHAGPRCIRWLLANRDRWTELRTRYRALVSDYVARLEEQEVARLAGYVALIALAVEVADEALDMPWSLEHGRQAIDTVWAGCVQQAADGRPEEKAMRLVLSWCEEHQAGFLGTRGKSTNGDAAESPSETRFEGMVLTREQRPTGEPCYGRWDIDERGEWEAIDILPRVLEHVLADDKFDAEEIKRKWADRGWTKCDKNRLVTKVRLRPGGKESRVVRILRRADSELDAAPDDDADDTASDTEALAG